jgi:multidrug efflux system outer membrane protein
VAVLASCSLEPRYHRPALPVADQWPADAARTPISDDTNAKDIGWRDFFDDARLQALIKQALENNRDLRVAVLNVASAREQYRIERAFRLPWVDAEGSYTHQTTPPVLESEVGSTARYYEAALVVPAFEVDLLGRVRSLSRAALQRYLAEAETRRNVHLVLISDVAAAYLSLAADRQLLQLARETFQNQSDAFRLTDRLHQTGGASGLDLAQARTIVEAARADVSRYEGNVARDVHSLQLLSGAQVGEDMLPQGLETTPANTIGALPAGIPSTVLLERPDVLAAEHLLRAANADVGAARAALFPTISLTAGLGRASEDLSNLFTRDSKSRSIVPAISVPLFEGGRRLADVRLSKAQRDIAVAQYERTIQGAFREVADGLALERTLSAQREAAAALVEATSRAYELSQQRFRGGRDSYLVVLDSQRRHYAAQQALIEVRLAEQVNRVTLYKALGGGWKEHTR